MRISPNHPRLRLVALGCWAVSGWCMLQGGRLAGSGTFFSIMVVGVLLLALLLLAIGAGCERAAPPPPAPADAAPVAVLATPREQSLRPDIFFLGTPQPVVDAMLELAEVESGDVLYDLGSGDGRIPITAAKRYEFMLGGTTRQALAIGSVLAAEPA